MSAVCSECSENPSGGQVIVGACSVGFFSDLYYQGTNVAGYIVFALLLTLGSRNNACFSTVSIILLQMK